MDERGRGLGTRPLAWWWFVAGEEQPRDRWNSETRQTEDYGIETIRLAELGELTAEELAALQDDANVAKLRVGTDSERFSDRVPVDQRTVELWERVKEALRD
jgi:hypothetical protein